MNIKEFVTENQLQVEHIKYFFGGRERQYNFLVLMN